ncbi:MAG: hypothetical protein ACRETL_14770, partial [Gammaproteobacteria bacterium]
MLDFVGQVSRHEAEPPDAEAQVVVAEKIDALRRSAPATGLGNMVEATTAHFGPDRSAQIVEMLCRSFGPGTPRRGHNIVDNARQFEVPVRLIAETSRRYGLFLRRLPPFLHSPGRRLAEKPGLAQH